MNCRVCSTSLSSDDKYCSGCGSKVEQVPNHRMPATKLIREILGDGQSFAIELTKSDWYSPAEAIYVMTGESYIWPPQHEKHIRTCKLCRDICGSSGWSIIPFFGARDEINVCDDCAVSILDTHKIWVRPNFMNDFISTESQHQIIIPMLDLSGFRFLSYGDLPIGTKFVCTGCSSHRRDFIRVTNSNNSKTINGVLASANPGEVRVTLCYICMRGAKELGLVTNLRKFLNSEYESKVDSEFETEPVQSDRNSIVQVSTPRIRTKEQAKPRKRKKSRFNQPTFRNLRVVDYVMASDIEVNEESVNDYNCWLVLWNTGEIDFFPRTSNSLQETLDNMTEFEMTSLTTKRRTKNCRLYKTGSIIFEIGSKEIIEVTLNPKSDVNMKRAVAFRKSVV